jgi:beta-lactam-binding protein with PASTA domain
MSTNASAKARFMPAPKCVVPALVHLTLAAAGARLASAHCRLGVIRRAISSRTAKRKVVSQSQPPGAHLPNGTGVAVDVGLGARATTHA